MVLAEIAEALAATAEVLVVIAGIAETLVATDEVLAEIAEAQVETAEAPVVEIAGIAETKFS